MAILTKFPTQPSSKKRIFLCWDYKIYHIYQSNMSHWSWEMLMLSLYLIIGLYTEKTENAYFFHMNFEWGVSQTSSAEKRDT